MECSHHETSILPLAIPRYVHAQIDTPVEDTYVELEVVIIPTW